jgi:hypothetical protein
MIATLIWYFLYEKIRGILKWRDEWGDIGPGCGISGMACPAGW